jgi:hypothetical protein
VKHEHGFRHALAFARQQHQLGIWEITDEASLLAVWDDRREALVTLDEDQALSVLATDKEINRLWRKHRGMSGKPGRLLIVDKARCQTLLARLREGSA